MPTEIPPGLTCVEPCEAIDCCIPFGLDDYLLVGGVVLNNEISVLFQCPEGYVCDPGVYPLLITIRAGEVPWHPTPTPNGLPLTIQCCDGPLTVQYASDISQADYQALLQSMVDEAARRLAGCREKGFRGPPKPPPLFFRTLPEGCCVGEPFEFQITIVEGAKGAIPPYNFTLTGGALPTGLAMSDTGLITGTPTVSGSFTANITATDSSPKQKSGSKTFTMRALEITNASSMPSAPVGVPYSQTLLQTNAIPPVSWQISSGTLPPGLTLDETTGVISGTPTVDPNPPPGDLYIFHILLQDEAS